MIITPIGAPSALSVPTVAELDPQPAATSLREAALAVSAPGPNPRVTFDPVLGVAILQFYEASPVPPVRYPDVAVTGPDARADIIA